MRKVADRGDAAHFVADTSFRCSTLLATIRVHRRCCAGRQSPIQLLRSKGSPRPPTRYNASASLRITPTNAGLAAPRRCAFCRRYQLRTGSCRTQRNAAKYSQRRTPRSRAC